MVFEWKIPVYRIPAQEAGEELLRIEKKHESLTPEAVVEESRPDDAVLHSCFEWDDAKAAEKYRVTQAQDVVRNLVTVQIHDDGETLAEPVRAFVNIVNKSYTPMSVVVQNKKYADVVLENALKELDAFHRKYEALKPLAIVLRSIESTLAEHSA